MVPLVLISFGETAFPTKYLGVKLTTAYIGCILGSTSFLGPEPRESCSGIKKRPPLKISVKLMKNRNRGTRNE